MRFAKSFESDENWYRINKKGGTFLLGWSIVILLLGLTCFIQPKINGPLVWVYGFAPILYIVAAAQSYAYARKL